MTVMNTQREHVMSAGDLNHQYNPDTTQAHSALAVRTEMVENYNTMTSEQQRQFPIQDPQQQSYYQLSAVNQQYHQSVNMNQAAWSSPQSMSADEFDSNNGNNNSRSSSANYSYRGQAVSTAYNPSPLSPRTWSAATQTPPPASTAQFDLPLRSQEPVFDGLSNQVSLSPDELRGADLEVHLHYDNGAFQHGFETRHLESEGFNYESSPATDAPGSPYTDSPASFHSDFNTEPKPIPELDCQQTPPIPKAPPRENASGEEPYAKLIHGALKNAPDHSMTLQELYKWFKDHTDKPHKTEGTGWQNSIRHNLSMNDAFKRRDPATFPHPDGNHAGSEKRASEWYLNPEYIDNIMPTTHFRDGNRGSSRNHFSRRITAPGSGGHRRNSPPRSSAVTHYQNPDYPSRSMPGRALSGRRGGRATTSARNARRQRSQTGSLSPVPGAAAQQHLQHYPYSPVQLQEFQARSDEMRRRNRSAHEQYGQHQGQRYEQRHLGMEAERMGHSIVGPVAPAGGPLTGNIGVGNTSAPVAFMGTVTTAGGSLPQPYHFQQFGLADVSGVYTSSPPADGVIYGWGSGAHL